MAVPRVYVRRGTTVWSVTNRQTSHSLTQDALTLIFVYLYTIGPKVREFIEGSERATVRMSGSNWNLRVWSSYLASVLFGSVLNDRRKLISKKLIFTDFRISFCFFKGS